MHVFDPLDQTLPEVTEVRELSCRLAVSLSAWPGNGWGDALAFTGPGNGYAGRDAAGVRFTRMRQSRGHPESRIDSGGVTWRIGISGYWPHFSKQCLTSTLSFPRNRTLYERASYYLTYPLSPEEGSRPDLQSNDGVVTDGVTGQGVLWCDMKWQSKARSSQAISRLALQQLAITRISRRVSCARFNPQDFGRRGCCGTERNRSFTQSQSGRTDSRDKAPGTSGLVSAHGILLIPLVTRNKTSRSWHKLSARMKGLVYP
ncbi:hypothetical protein Acr_00g0003680 [Actinidia rufa]|uniref:Uncharacterized protein n=1 Tax=Actinidia rufa TaxID=165716 RepID=A0A7J0D799_9ERIC|nr:hypothetical protein Acr_00g0003680 [Actinidia rufa]